MPISLWDTTMNPETRTLIRVKIDDVARAERRITTLMGDKVEPRRKWIEVKCCLWSRRRIEYFRQ